MHRVYEFLKKANVYYLATVENNHPRVRPFGTIDLFNDKLYIQTGKIKSVAEQIKANPNIEISAMCDGRWLRLSARPSLTLSSVKVSQRSVRSSTLVSSST